MRVPLVASPEHENRFLLYVHRCNISRREILLWWRSTGATCTPSNQRLSTGDGVIRARSSGRYQLQPWYHPHMIILLLSCLLCCVVRDRVGRDLMRVEDFVWGVLDEPRTYVILGSGKRTPHVKFARCLYRLCLVCGFVPVRNRRRASDKVS